MSEWKTYKLGEIAEVFTGFPFKGDLYNDSEGTRVLRGENITIGNLRWDTVKYWNEEFSQYNKYELRENDIVIGMDGSRVGKNRAQIKSYDLPLLLAQRVARIRAKKGIDQDFLAQVIKSSRFEGYIKLVHTGTSIPHISAKQIKDFEITIPSLPTQRQIAAILSSLDDKIELNLQMNQTLEAMAQTIFKEWFVDFNFPSSEYDLKDYKMDKILEDYSKSKNHSNPFNPKNPVPDNGLPKGWRWVAVGELFKSTIGGDWGKEEYSDEFSENVFVVRGTDFEKIANGNILSVPNRFVKKTNFFKREIKNGDILLEISGGSKDQPTGRTILFTDELLSQFNNSVVPASFCRLIRPKSFDYSLFLDAFLKYFYQIGGTWEYQNQSTGISNFQFVHFSENKKIALPDDELIIRNFSEIIKPMKIKIDENTLQIQSLTQLRDTLLPKLMSGQIRLNTI